MTPIIEVSDKTLETLSPKDYRRREDLERGQIPINQGDFIHVPSINLYVSKQRTLQGKNWFDAHSELQRKGSRMLTPMQFVEFLKYARENHKDIYNDITQVRGPWRAEWLDADFKVAGKKLYINYNHVLDSQVNLIPKNSELLDSDTLMKDRTPGISLEDWLDSSHTIQGFPSKSCKEGSLYYWYSRSNNNSVSRFGVDSDSADLSCGRYPSGMYSVLGVREARTV